WIFLYQFNGDRLVTAVQRRAGPHSSGAHSGRAVAPLNYWPPNSLSSAARWLAPRPRIRRDSAMLSRSMICLARTLPTPGSDSSRAETFILPMTSLVWPSLRTSVSEIPPCLRRCLTSARSFLAFAAFSRAAARCSGVRGGRATPGHLGFLSFSEGGRLRKLVGSAPLRQRKGAFHALFPSRNYAKHPTNYPMSSICRFSACLTIRTEPRTPLTTLT